MFLLGIYRRRAYKSIFRGEIASAPSDENIPLEGIQITNLHTTAPFSGTMEPIPLDKFKDHVERMHSNDDYLFSEEYSVSSHPLTHTHTHARTQSIVLNHLLPQSLEPSHAPTSNACHSSCNIAKNRYANIVACELYYFQTDQQASSVSNVFMCYFICADDHSRVILSEDPNKEGSDYINANHIDVRQLFACLSQIY